MRRVKSEDAKTPRGNGSSKDGVLPREGVMSGNGVEPVEGAGGEIDGQRDSFVGEKWDILNEEDRL
jgi:hypothetical protein